MGLFKRGKSAVEAQANAMLDKIENANPKATLDQAVRDAKKQLATATDGLAKIEELAFSFQKKLADAQEAVKSADKNMTIFAKAGKKDLFLKAQTEKQTQEKLVVSYQASHEKYAAQAEETRKTVDGLKTKIKDMETREAEYVARIEAARSVEEVNKALSGLSVDSFGHTLDRFEELANQAEARASATAHVYGEEKSLDEQAAELEAQQAEDNVDDLMAQYANK